MNCTGWPCSTPTSYSPLMAIMRLRPLAGREGFALVQQFDPIHYWHAQVGQQHIESLRKESIPAAFFAVARQVTSAPAERIILVIAVRVGP